MNPYSLLNLLTSIAVLLLGSVVFYRSRSRVNFLFFIFTSLVFIWLFFYFLAYNATNEDKILFYFKLGYAAIIFIPITWFHFCCKFLNKTGRFFYLYSVGYLIGLFYVFLFFNSPYFVSYVKKFNWGYYPIVFLKSHLAFIGYFNFYFTYAILLLFFEIRKKARHADSLHLSKIRYLFWASLVGTFAAIDFVPNYGMQIFPFGFLFMLFFVVIVSYAIAKVRLLDLSLAITKSSIFISVYSLVLGVPFLAVIFYKAYLVYLFKENWWIVPLLLSTFLATSGPFIYLYVDKRAEARLLKEQRSYQNILRDASSGMIRVKDLRRLLNLIVHVITKTVKIKHASIYLLDKDNSRFLLQAVRGKRDIFRKDVFIDFGSPLIWRLTTTRESVVTEEAIMKLGNDPKNISLNKLVEQLLQLDAFLVVPSLVDNDLIGLLVLGEKTSKKLYSQDDLNVFSVLANQAALAIENAQFYDEIKRTHEQLFQAEKLATIGTMADGLSHQINNRFHALSLISGDALDVLRTFDMSNCNDETKQIFFDLKGALERVESNVMQGGEVVKGLLKYSRPGDTGFERIDLRDALNGAIDMVQYKIKLKDIDLIQNIPADLPKFLGNLTQLQEVFFNLIDNAYDAIKERQLFLNEDAYKGRLEIIAAVDEGSIGISIADNGMGVKEQDRKKLFTPFFTTKATSKKGTGLGLYVIEKIISAHNGKVQIESTYQVGTRFTIAIPITN